MERVLSTLTALSIGVAVTFAPLAFGAVEPWAYALLGVFAYTALATAIGCAIMTGRQGRLPWPMLVPAALALLLLWVQYVEWPAELLRRVSPNALEIHRDAYGGTGGKGTTGFSPSLYRHATSHALICLSSYVALFAATCVYVRSQRRHARLAALVASVGFGVSLFGILQNLSGTGKLYWWRELTHGGAPFGPFVSRNQFAAYAGMCLFLGLGLAFGRGAPAASLLEGRQRTKRKTAARRAHQNLLLGFLIAIIGAAIIWSLSRGGILSLLLSFAGAMMALGLAGIGRKRIAYVVAVVVAMLGCITYLGWEPVTERLFALRQVAQDPLATWRWRMYADAYRIAADFPVLGTGAGTFLSIYPLYRSIPTDSLARSPHNEYLHVLAETGLCGLALLVAGLGLLYGAVLRGLKSSHSTYARGFLAGGVGLLLMVTLHSTVDFPTRSPAIAGTLAVAAGLLWQTKKIDSNRNWANTPCKGQPSRADPVTLHPAEGRASDSLKRTSCSTRRRRKWRTIRTVLALLAVGTLWALACDFALNPLRCQLEERLIHRALKQPAPDTQEVLGFVASSEKNIASYCAEDAQLHAALAEFCRFAAAQTEDFTQKVALAEKSLKFHQLAARLEPVNAEHAFQLAVDYLVFQRPDLAWQQAERACKLQPHDPWIRARLAELFLAYGQRELGDLYLGKAEQLAAARGIKKVRPFISDIQKEFQRSTQLNGEQGAASVPSLTPVLRTTCDTS